MARRNAKKVRNGFVLPVPFAGIVVLVCTIGLSFTWLDCRCDALGDEIKALENEIVELDKKYNREEYRWSFLKAPKSIMSALDRNGIAMTWPRDNQVVRLYDSRYSLTLWTAGRGAAPKQAVGVRRFAMNE